MQSCAQREAPTRLTTLKTQDARRPKTRRKGPEWMLTRLIPVLFGLGRWHHMTGTVSLVRMRKTALKQGASNLSGP